MSSDENPAPQIEKQSEQTCENKSTEENPDKSGEVPTEKANAQEHGNEENTCTNENNKSSETPSIKSEAPAKCVVHKADFEKDVVYLYQFSRTPLLPSLSPFCLKVETWLRLTGVKYENVDHKMRFRSKKGQLPFIELNGEEIPDSAIIIKELSAKFSKDIDAHLTSEQRNISYAMIAMLENHLIWIIFYWRAKYPENVLKGYKVNLQHALGLRVPNSILNFFFKFTFGRKGSKKLKAHGIGVHSASEIEEFGKNDLNVLSEMLDTKQFFFGDTPTTLDVVAFAVLSQIYFLAEDVSYVLKEYMLENCSNLVQHVLRMKEKCFADWDEICTKLDLNAHMGKPDGKQSSKNTDNTNADKEKDKDKVNSDNLPEPVKEKDIDEGSGQEGNKH